MNVSVSPAAQQELIDGAMFYAERADRELGLAFIAEFEHARGLLAANPETGADAKDCLKDIAAIGGIVQAVIKAYEWVDRIL